MSTSNRPSPGSSYSELQDKLQRAVAAVCPGWLSDQQDDLVQVALLRVMDLQRRSEGERRFSSSYLWKVAHSAMIDEIRRHRRRQEVALEDASPVEFPAQRSSSPEDGARSTEIHDGIQECLRGLVTNRKEAVTLYLLGHTVPEAAKILEWTVKKTENLVYRGLKNLRECLGTKGLEP